MIRADAATEQPDSAFVPMTPCRLFDTRPDVEFHVGSLFTFGPDETQPVQAHGLRGECDIPLDAIALSLNVTAVDASLPTHLTVWPGGAMPRASSLNPLPGEVAFNAVTVPLASGTFQVYNLQGVVDVIADVNGYYTSAVLDDLDSRLGSLEANQPLVGTRVESDPQVIDETARTLAEVYVPHPFVGRQVVDYSVNVEQDEAGVVVECWINAELEFTTYRPGQVWESPGNPGGSGHLSGTSADERYSPGSGASLVCKHSGAEHPTIATNARVTTVFYPAATD